MDQPDLLVERRQKQLVQEQPESDNDQHVRQLVASGSFTAHKDTTLATVHGEPKRDTNIFCNEKVDQSEFQAERQI